VIIFRLEFKASFFLTPRSPVIISRLDFKLAFFYTTFHCPRYSADFSSLFTFAPLSFQYHVPTFKPYLQFHASQGHALPSQLPSPAPSSMWRHKTSATATRVSHTSVDRNHGNMADSGGCCAGGHLGAPILQSLKNCNLQMITEERGIKKCIFLFNKSTLKVFVTYLTGALYVPFVILRISTRKWSFFETVCSMSAVMVSMVVHRHHSKLHSKQNSTNITHHYLH